VRENNRKKILDAAVRVVQRDGVNRLTLEAVAEETGVTRGGMTYHFRDRAALSLALQEHLASSWEESLTRAAGKAADQATAKEKAAAYATVAMASATSGELELILQGGRDASLSEPWRQVLQRWTPSIEDAIADPTAMRLFILRLAADGLWVYDSLNGHKLSTERRQTIADQITTFADGKLP